MAPHNSEVLASPIFFDLGYNSPIYCFCDITGPCCATKEE